MNWESLTISLPLIIVALTVHEFAHALTATACGDQTAKNQGRLTLNPFSHLDLVGSLLFIFAGFGWAKPVPVDTENLKHPRWQMPLIAAAGPFSNLILAIASILAMVYLPLPEAFQYPLQVMLALNVMLIVLNMLPIPPLDGSQILRGILPESLGRKFDELAPFGFILLIVIFFFPMGRGFFGAAVFAVQNFLLQLMGVV